MLHAQKIECKDSHSVLIYFGLSRQVFALSQICSLDIAKQMSSFLYLATLINEYFCSSYIIGIRESSYFTKNSFRCRKIRHYESLFYFSFIFVTIEANSYKTCRVLGCCRTKKCVLLVCSSHTLECFE